MSKSICDDEFSRCTPKAKAGEFYKLDIDSEYKWAMIWAVWPM